MATNGEAKGPDSSHDHNYDVIIVGAGISGINTSYRLQTLMPHLRFTVLEARDTIGGTWDLFRYPGIRSDSDLHTFGFAWHPWPHPTPIAEGPLIMSYLRECVEQHGLARHLRFRHHVQAADWSSSKERWTLRVDAAGDGHATKTYAARFLILGAGYYDYKQPFKTVIPGLDAFAGKIIHPQFWPDDYDYTDKRMAIIGSGATAITLLPALAKTARHVTLLQRSPSYILPTANTFPGPRILLRLLSKTLLRLFERAWWLTVPRFFMFLSKNFPATVRASIRAAVLPRLPPGVPHDPHFSPAYNPWEQRMCMSPDGDFFAALHGGNAEVVTGAIRTVTADGIELADGRSVPDLDAIVTATGIRLRFGGEIPLSVDGRPFAPAGRLIWNGAMVEGLPNLFFVIGYTNASWTLGADDTAFILARLVRFMEGQGVGFATPRVPRDYVSGGYVAAWDLKSTYAKEAEGRMPRYGRRGPWRARNNVLVDYSHARWGDVTRGLHFEV